MARKLKTFITSIGFYDLAVAAPSTKVALDAWGSKQNLFHQGLAQETDALDIVAAAMEKPGVVLRRAVGTKAPFREHAVPPKSIAGTGPRHPPKAKRQEQKAKAGPQDRKAQKAAIVRFEEAQAARAREREREEAYRAAEQAAEQREEEHQRRAVAKAKAILDRARERHEEKIGKLEEDRRLIDERAEKERRRWRQEEKELEQRIREAGA